MLLISAKKHRLWVFVRTASQRRVLTSTHNLCFEQKYEKYLIFFCLKIFNFSVINFSVYLNRHVFVMTCGRYSLKAPPRPPRMSSKQGTLEAHCRYVANYRP